MYDTISKLKEALKLPFTTAKHILDTDYPDEPSRIDSLLPYSGLVLFCGPFKSAKSFFILFMAHCITTAKYFLGKLIGENCQCLYLALEDSEHRLKKRFNKMKIEPTDDLIISTQWSYDQRGIIDLSKFLVSCPSVKVIIIDTLGRFSKCRAEANFQSDYDFMGKIKEICDRHNVLIIFVHHTRKMRDENDIFNMISGTVGNLAAADEIILLQRERNSKKAKLHITSRDFPEIIYDIEFDENCCWQMIGEAKLRASTPERQRIFDILRNTDELSPSQIAEKIPGATAKNVSNLLALMKDEGIVVIGTKRGLWSAVKELNQEMTINEKNVAE
jgi:RecA-family ATPase